MGSPCPARGYGLKEIITLKVYRLIIQINIEFRKFALFIAMGIDWNIIGNKLRILSTKFNFKLISDDKNKSIYIGFDSDFLLPIRLILMSTYITRISVIFIFIHS